MGHVSATSRGSSGTLFSNFQSILRDLFTKTNVKSAKNERWYGQRKRGCIKAKAGISILRGEYGGLYLFVEVRRKNSYDKEDAETSLQVKRMNYFIKVHKGLFLLKYRE